ncbi:MAG TPA: winged helix DNA-binding protein, partial [Allosphingosinicella sp.]|nr:winged helix DNA-binding protein [Allosphingosinicella sp.]
GLACARQPARLHDVGKGQAPPRLQQLSEEVGRIATILASLSESELIAEPQTVPGEGGEADLNSSMVRAIIRARRLRDQYFGGELFADPAWDMLLDLMAARLDRQRVAVSSLCIAAAIPPTTALRWIKTLTDHGLFVRTADPQDGRRVFIELSDHAAAQLAAYLRAVQRVSPHAI